MSSTRNPARIATESAEPARRPAGAFDPEAPSPLAAVRFGLGHRLGGSVPPLSPAALARTLPERAAPLPQGSLEETRLRVVGAAQLRAEQAALRKQGDAKAVAALQERRRLLLRDLYGEDTDRYLSHLVTAKDDLAERLVLFWTDHFAVSAAPFILRPLVPAMVEEAIRPRIHARFADLLAATVLHPAMLLYLNQQASVGPNSPAGRRRSAGLNENLAREILELHTLGVDGGYGQRDVESLARVLTGVKVDMRTGEVAWRRAAAEPGRHEVFGRAFAPASSGEAAGGMDEVRLALAWLATRPQTARFVTGKLADHFAGPGHAPALRERLAETYLSTEGDLAAVMRTLVLAPEAWDRELRNLRQPVEYAVALARLVPFGASTGDAAGRWNGSTVRRAATTMGQRPWYAPSPAGWPKDADYWLTAAGLSARLEWAGRAARALARSVDAPTVLEKALGGLASPRTRAAVLRAPNRTTAITLALASPEFNRR